MPGVSRRTVAKAAGIVTGAVVLPAAALSGWIWVTADKTNVGRVTFDQALHIPELLAPPIDADGVRGFEVSLQEGTAEFLPGNPANTWGINGPYLGPTLRLARGDAVHIDVTNSLPEATTIHWHGMELPARMDGGPHQVIDPGDTWSPAWHVDQLPATLWYHPHPHGETQRHVYQGLAGLIIIEDDDPSLPVEYGVDDIPLILQDKEFGDHGQLTLDTSNDWFGTELIGFLGSDILVNGTWGPFLEVDRAMIRFRVLNAANARIFDVAFDDGRQFMVVANDVGHLPAPVPVDHFMLSPGERVEFLCAFEPGERCRMVSRPPDLDANFIVDRLAGGGDGFELLEIRAAQTLDDDYTMPERLPAPPPVDDVNVATTRKFVLGDFNTINGVAMDMSRIDFVVSLGGDEVWEIENGSLNPHNFHVHNAAFTILDIGGQPPPEAMSGRKDTVYVSPGSTVRVAIMFGQYADPRMPYMLHCHLLVHEDAGMMQQFVLVEPGTEGDVVTTIDPYSHDGH